MNNKLNRLKEIVNKKGKITKSTIRTNIVINPGTPKRAGIDIVDELNEYFKIRGK